MRKLPAALAVLAAAAVITLAGCHSSDSSGHAKAAASSFAANPTTSADIAQVEKVFKPCFEPADGSVPAIHGAISCAEGKVPAMQDKSARHTILYHLGTCELSAYHQAGSWAAFKVSGWQPCAQAAYNAALAAGAAGATSSPSVSPAASVTDYGSPA